MIKKYDDIYIDLNKIDAITAITQDFVMYTDKTDYQYEFTVYINGNKLHFTDVSEKGLKRLQALRERIIKDWMEVKNERD